MQETQKNEPNGEGARVNRRIETKKWRTALTTVASAQTTQQINSEFCYLESRKQLIMVFQTLVAGAMWTSIGFTFVFVRSFEFDGVHLPKQYGNLDRTIASLLEKLNHILNYTRVLILMSSGVFGQAILKIVCVVVAEQ